MNTNVERAPQTLYASIRRASNDAFRLEVELTLSPGITILFGPSGAGKTTLLDCLSGLSRPDSGRIVAGGTTLFDDEQRIAFPPQKRNCGYLFQTLALFPHMTARQNIEYGLTHLSKAERRSKSDAILRSFRIAELEDRKPFHISGGERQRVALARALVTDPPLPSPRRASNRARRRYQIRVSSTIFATGTTPTGSRSSMSRTTAVKLLLSASASLFLKQDGSSPKVRRRKSSTLPVAKQWHNSQASKMFLTPRSLRCMSTTEP